MSQSPPGPDNESSNIFINYRRADTSGHAGRLEQELSRRFPGRVFMDIHTIEVGTDFADAINSEVGKCVALIVLIGNQWLDITDPKTGKRRLDNPNDFVAIEIAEALKRNTRVIPVLVEGAKMPEAEELPASLAALVRRNAIEISDTRWDYDVQQLIKVLEKICGSTTPLRTTRTGTGDGTITGTGTGTTARWGVAKIAIMSTVAILLVIAALIMFLRSGKETQPPSSNDAVAGQSPAPRNTQANAVPSQPPDEPGELQASAVVDLAGDKAVFVFPLITKGREWTLGEAEGDTYRWDVTVEQGVTQYYLEFIVNNREGAGSERGYLASLLNKGLLSGVWKTSIGNSEEWVTQPRMEFKHKVLPDRLELTVKGKGIKTVFAKEPKQASLRMKTPKATIPEVFDAVIDYK